MSPAKREAAGIVRRAVWRGRVPTSPDRYPWSMARELHTWQRLVDAGTDPHELNAALGQLRTVYPAARRLTCLVSVPGLLADLLQAARAEAARRRGSAGLADGCTAIRGIMSQGRSGAPRSLGQLGLSL